MSLPGRWSPSTRRWAAASALAPPRLTGAVLSFGVQGGPCVFHVLILDQAPRVSHLPHPRPQSLFPDTLL